MPETQNLALAIVETVAETVSEPLLVLDSRMRIRSANQAFYRAFRVSPDQIQGQLLYSISDCRWNILDLRDLLGRVLRDHEPFQDLEIEQDFPGVGNRLLVLSGRQLDGFPLILLAIDDLTDRRERDLRLAAIVETSDDAIVSKTLDGTIVSWNSGAERIYGYAAHEMIGRPSSTLAPEGHEEEMPAIMERIRRGEKVRNFETKRRRKDGAVIDVSVTISPITGYRGVITGVSMVDRDITEIKHAQQEHLAKQKLESVGTLAGGIAHDFNNLLGGVQAYSDLALAELADGSNPKQELERIRAGAVRGAQIVRQLMIYAGEESEALELVDVSQIVEDMLELLKFSVSKHAKLETNLVKGMPAVRANPGQLAQVVMNLITNASEALGKHDGIIRVTTGLVKIGRDSAIVASETLPESNYVQVEVSDTGAGMTLEMQARVFDPFFTTKLPGHGLGLAVVQGAVRKLGGALRLASEPGKGTTFQILLPCAKDAASVGGSAIMRTEEQRPERLEATVLVVEDEEPLRHAVSKMLRKKGFCILEASEGNAALEWIRAYQGRIDVLLLDITLPGASSREIFEEAKRLRSDARIIVTSAYSKEMAAASLAGKVERFIRKPFGLDELVELIGESPSSS